MTGQVLTPVVAKQLISGGKLKCSQPCVGFNATVSIGRIQCQEHSKLHYL
jgi:hypothetical protein